jgi:(1->4)-alpha-D-glucan 1-alpha-D-glucosylmutase
VVGDLDDRSAVMAPAIPIATYRLQLTPSFGFEDAAKTVPYLKALGISHLYASPFLKARSGSTHGYDIIDHNALNPEFCGEDAFLRLSAALAQADIGLILDFVPNHMGVHYADNEWWLDVLEWGPKSPYADFFDIDWQTLPARPQGGVLIPVLGRPYGEALENGEIEIRYDRAEGSFSAWYYEHKLPIGPSRYGEMLEKIVAAAGASEETAGRRLLEIAAGYRGPHNPTRERAPGLKAEIAAIAGSQGVIERGLKAYQPKSGESGALLALHHLLERQHYRVAHWRLAGSDINYRRFFDINSLAGLRVEDKDTFQAIHRLVARLIQDGRLQGLRLDHIDGLRDPHQYFRRLTALIEARRPANSPDLYLVIEKILGEDEHLPRFAGVSGTTGYEWLNVISRVLVDERGIEALDRVWRETSGETRSFEDVLIEAKGRVLDSSLASEFTVLSHLLARIATGHYSTRDFSASRLRAAFRSFILHFPIYRTYITGSGPSGADRKTIETAIDKARSEWFGPDIAIFDFLRDTLTLDLIAPGRVGHSIARVRRFARKVQQFTGPMMAKSLEDTAFYRFHRLLALNEVGGSPEARGLTAESFHHVMQSRAKTFLHGLTATATHDTKRGEDARTRLLALSELTDEWGKAVGQWRKLNAHLIISAGGARVPSPAHEYMLYQALLGAWPLHGVDQAFIERVQAYAVKAAREGKQQTSWLVPDERYEKGLTDFIGGILDRAQSSEFTGAFDAFARRTALMGALNSLSQLVLKTTIPGVPDIYQGTELWDLSFVDPDNRRPVDFAARAAGLAALADPNWQSLVENWSDGRIKFALLHRLLAIRQQFAAVFTDGAYHPLAVEGRDRDEVLAFARTSGGRAVIVAAGRLFARSTDRGRQWPSGDAWQATIRIDGFSSVRNALALPEPLSGSELPVSKLFHPLPVAILRADWALPPRKRTMAKGAKRRARVDAS